VRFLVTYLLAGAALAVLFFGPLVLLPVVGAVATGFGPVAGLLALVGVLLVCAVVMRGLARLVDVRTGDPEPAAAVPDRVFCLRCGGAAAPDGVVCARCGGTRFGLAPPAPPPTVPVPVAPGAPRSALGPGLAPGLGDLLARLAPAPSAPPGRVLWAVGDPSPRRGKVYVRVVRGRCDPARLAPLRRLAEDRLVLSLRRRPGLLAWYGGGDPAAGTLFAISLWDSAAAARAAGPRPRATAFEALGARFDLPEDYEAVLRT
jgi:hypothetical protein